MMAAVPEVHYRLFLRDFHTLPVVGAAGETLALDFGGPSNITARRVRLSGFVVATKHSDAEVS